MKVLLSFLFITGLAHGAVKTWEDIIAKATPSELNDMGQVIQQIRIVPSKDPKTGRVLYKVLKVEAGSVFDRQGVKVGDLIAIEDPSASLEMKAGARPDSQ